MAGMCLVGVGSRGIKLQLHFLAKKKKKHNKSDGDEIPGENID